MQMQISKPTDGTIKKKGNLMPSWMMPVIKLCIVFADVILAGLCFILAFSIREQAPVFSQSAWAWSKEFVPYAGILYFTLFIRPALLIYQGIYRFQGAFTYTRESLKVFKAVSVGSLLIVAWAFLFRGGFAFREFSYSRAVFLWEFVVALAIFILFHLLVRAIQASFRKKGINLIPTLIVGTNPESEQTINVLNQRPELGYSVVGVLGSERDEFPLKPVANSIDDLADVIKNLEIQEVIITDNRFESEKLFESMMQINRKQKVEFRFAPTLFNLLPQKTSVEQIGVLPMVKLFREPLSDAARFIKRAFDIILSSIVIILLCPIYLILALVVKFDSKGKILFAQERVGMDGRLFLCYKYRTMAQDADDSAHRSAYKENIKSRGENSDDVSKLFGKVENDTRITKAGHWLRRSSLDELPQLFNVLKGDMSIVGPRPPIPYEVVDYDIKHRKRLDMKPGITGLWQVSGRSRLSFEEMVKIDIFYIENWSFWLDLKIILLTLPAVFRGDGAR